MENDFYFLLSETADKLSHLEINESKREVNDLKHSKGFGRTVPKGHIINQIYNKTLHNTDNDTTSKGYGFDTAANSITLNTNRKNAIFSPIGPSETTTNIQIGKPVKICKNNVFRQTHSESNEDSQRKPLRYYEDSHEFNPYSPKRLYLIPNSRPIIAPNLNTDSLKSSSNNTINSRIYNNYLEEKSESSEENFTEDRDESSEDQDDVKDYLTQFESRMEKFDHSNVDAFYPALTDVCQRFKITSVAVKEVSQRLMVLSVREWHPIKNMFDIVDFFTECQRSIPAKLYETLFAKTWSKAVESYLKEEWDVEDSICLLDLVDGWRPLIPLRCYDRLLKRVYKELKRRLKIWEPVNDDESPSPWVMPWKRLLEDRFNKLMKIVIKKLMKALRSLDVKDMTAVEILQDWREAFDQEDIDTIFETVVQEKLVKALKDLSLDTGSMDFIYLDLVMAWSSLISSHILENILILHFFPRMIATLGTLLPQIHDLKIIGNWYKNWTNAFSEDFKKNPKIKKEIQKMLKMLVSRSKPEGVNDKKSFKPCIRFDPGSIQSNRERVELAAFEHGIPFHPKVGHNSRYQNSQVYHLGETDRIYFDREVTYILKQSSWVPISLKDLFNNILKNK